MAAESTKSPDPRWAWQPYRASKEAPWNLQRVGHLYRRAAFGATHAELEAGLKAGPNALIAQLFKGGPGQKEFDDEMAPLARNIAQLQRLRPSACLVVGSHVARPTSITGENHALLAQPLRHQQRQGAERPLHARPVRADAASTPWATSPRCCTRCPATRPC